MIFIEEFGVVIKWELKPSGRNMGDYKGSSELKLEGSSRKGLSAQKIEAWKRRRRLILFQRVL